jgi:hypothetical protein
MTVSNSREDFRVEATYYPDYGLHAIEPLDTDSEPVTIASFPNWPQTRDALATASLRGIILTPELATAAESPLEWTTDPEQAYRHVEEARELSQSLPDATLLLGAPLHIWSNSQQKSHWLNGVAIVQNGEAVGWVFKQTPLPVETKVLGIDKPTTNPNRVLGESAILICNELLLHSHIRDHANPGAFALRDDYLLKGEPIRQVLAPSIWPIPNKLPDDWDPDKVNVGSHDYYRERLEFDVKLGVLAAMQTVERVIVADRGRSGFPYPFTDDIPPYNAVFTRLPAEP